MDLVEFYSCLPLSLYRLIFTFVDYILKVLRFQSLRGSVCHHALYWSHLWLYVYVLTKANVAQNSDIVIACYTCFHALYTLQFCAKLYGWHAYRALINAKRIVTIHGWKRCLIYRTSLVVVASCLVYLLIFALSLSWGSVSAEVRGRLDNNIKDIEEDRSHYDKVMVHPVTLGEKDPVLFHQLYRYPMEDVEMKCCVTMLWISDSRPSTDQIAWRRNGARIHFNDRYDHEVEFREIPEQESSRQAIFREFRFSEYEINATLTIKLLRDSEFGSYTCHAAKMMNVSKESLAEYVKKNNKTDTHKAAGESSKTKRATKSARQKKKKAVDIKRLFQDVFTWKEEFRLVKMSRRQEAIKSPASSILSFTTSYWHLSERDAIEVEYTVNGKSFSELCPDAFHGCSKTLMVYWWFGHAHGRFGVPPLHLFTVWKNHAFPAERFTLLHCLCENAYGYHRVRYLRRYYNRTTQNHDMIEITHPHTLVVVPRDQHMLNLFRNRSECSHVIERPPCVATPPVCKSSWDFSLIRDFAEVAVKYFHWTERAFIAFLLIVMVLGIRNANSSLSWLGRQIAILTLDGSMAFLSTAIVSTTGQALPYNNGNERSGRMPQYDVYLSYSDTLADTKKVLEEVVPVLESKGLAVCARGRDVTPGQPEVQGVSEVIERSKRAVIFLSGAYLSDTFMTDLEAPTIIEHFSGGGGGPPERSLQDVLVVKLESMDVPLWLSQLPAEDWATSCRTTRDHLLTLLRWLDLKERRRTFRGSVVDMGVTFTPLLLVTGIAVLSLFQYVGATTFRSD